jgi:sodium-independent sulfate anion transporter 11
MGKIGERVMKIKNGFRYDHNFNALRRSLVRAGKALPTSTQKYAVQKVPILQWLPNYIPKWLLSDIIAGVTVGFLLIPQALAFAALAGIPLQDGLLASWLPALIYSVMGTSKGKIMTWAFYRRDRLIIKQISVLARPQ